MIGILGGTFDPIHFGHIKPALELLTQLPLDEVRFIPCHIPPHRPPPTASPTERWQMVKMVANHQAGLFADARELNRNGPSYTVDTLLDLRTEFGSACPLGLIMGSDAFCSLASWDRWQWILELSHIIIVSRPDNSLPTEGVVAGLLERSMLKGPDALKLAPHGGILSRKVTPVDISSSVIRDCIRAGQSPRYMLPGKVWAYIKRHGLYGVDE
jgi:nicotinate-nucleotide adenylyltransferase